MIREYIFCSVIESPQMARRSPGWSSSPSRRRRLERLIRGEVRIGRQRLPRLRPQRAIRRDATTTKRTFICFFMTVTIARRPPGDKSKNPARQGERKVAWQIAFMSLRGAQRRSNLGPRDDRLLCSAPKKRLVRVARPKVSPRRLVALGRPLTVGARTCPAPSEDTVKRVGKPTRLAVPPKAGNLVSSTYPPRRGLATRNDIEGGAIERFCVCWAA